MSQMTLSGVLGDMGDDEDERSILRTRCMPDPALLGCGEGMGAKNYCRSLMAFSFKEQALRVKKDELFHKAYD